MMTLEQYQEREGLLDRIDDLESKLSALQSERDQLKKERDNLDVQVGEYISTITELKQRLHDKEILRREKDSTISNMMNALIKIRDMDYRGNRSSESQMAHEALQSLKLKGK